MSLNKYKLICENRKARHDYNILETFEAGLVLMGSEVKSIRENKVSLNEGYIIEKDGEIFLSNVHIAEYKGANRFNHEPKRLRKLLLKKREINKIMGQIKLKGLTVIPLKLYSNQRNYLKLEIAIAKGKQSFDKREAIKERDWKIEKSRLLREK